MTKAHFSEFPHFASKVSFTSPWPVDCCPVWSDVTVAQFEAIFEAQERANSGKSLEVRSKGRIPWVCWTPHLCCACLFGLETLRRFLTFNDNNSNAFQLFQHPFSATCAISCLAGASIFLQAQLAFGMCVCQFSRKGF